MEKLAEKIRAARPLSWYRPGRVVNVRDKMQRCTYTLTEPPGKHFAAGFRPALSPARMLKMGVFEGKYLNDGTQEFPREWFENGRLRPVADPTVNEFGIKSRLSLQAWRRNGWIPAGAGDQDIRGWFQWYCRYWIGRRGPTDEIQIARWRAFARHRGQILASYRRLGRRRPHTRAEKRLHRPRQRQALLQWAYDPYV